MSEDETHEPIRDPESFQRIAEAARLALRHAGPTSGLIGTAAACMDRQLADMRDAWGEIAERRRARLASSDNWQQIGDVAGTIVERLSRASRNER